MLRSLIRREVSERRNYPDNLSFVLHVVKNMYAKCPTCVIFLAYFQIITGALGIFGVGVFAVPVGLLGAGFQEYVEAFPDKVCLFFLCCR